MRLTVTRRYVDLEFEGEVPLKLSQQFSTEEIAETAARAIARHLRIRQIRVYSPFGGKYQKKSVPSLKGKNDAPAP